MTYEENGCGEELRHTNIDKQDQMCGVLTKYSHLLSEIYDYESNYNMSKEKKKCYKIQAVIMHRY